MKDVEILAFRADERASAGITSSHLDDVIAAYDPAKQTAPVVIGHPSNDAPAHGEIAGLRRDGSSLFVTVKNLGSAVVDGVRKSKLVNRSIAFWDPHHPSNPNPGKLALRHFGFLGANSPGIPNLGKLSFAADDDDTLIVEGEPAAAVIFSAAPTAIETVTEPPAPAPAPAPQQENDVLTPEQIAERDRLATEREEAIARRETEFAAREKAAYEAANGAAADRLVASGHLLPADKDALVTAFNAIPGGVLEFSATDKTSPVDKIVSIFGKAGKVAPGTGDTRTSPTGQAPIEFAAPGESDAKAKADAALAAENARQASAHAGK